ncbi:uncharacterized protein LOC120414495 [Culex pipiens pallens]|uniref:uncharacterized protein LOC120414495 n=1 Tax=Culex pipiens pallens TaxID=42434 RepID=UPI001954B337|nr:uncharacterized protein LOC120414495 [Culex pipiens pallens]
MADDDTKHGGDNRVDTTTGDIRAPTSLDNRPFRSHLDGALQQFGSQQPDKIVTTKYLERYRRIDLDAFVNDFATKSEECVYARMGDCAEFVQVTNWCELMQSAGLKDTCNNELALAMKVIANTEQFPEVKNANGVDFRLLYLNLSNMMLGHPVQEMNEATAKVLKEVYEETWSQLRQSDNNENAALLRNRLQNILPPMSSVPVSSSNAALDVLFADSNLNPLQLPVEKLFTSKE